MEFYFNNSYNNNNLIPEKNKVYKKKLRWSPIVDSLILILYSSYILLRETKFPENQFEDQ